MIKEIEAVQALIRKSETVKSSVEALQWSQAASNAAHALAELQSLKK